MCSRPPTENVPLTYAEWLEKAKASLAQPDVEVEHFYLQLSDDRMNTLVFAPADMMAQFVQGVDS